MTQSASPRVVDKTLGKVAPRLQFDQIRMSCHNVKMRRLSLISCFLSVSLSPVVHATIQTLCVEQMNKMTGPSPSGEDISAACGQVKQLDPCVSTKGVPIYHFDRIGTNKNPKRILAKALIHGDEHLSGSVARAWLIRLAKIEPRNTWRVIPVANPDGWEAKTRTNVNGIDLNRNFPTKDWTELAEEYWRKKMKSDPRRFPGKDAGSESETKCLMAEFDDFKPDFIISIHTPLGVLDLDGPKVNNPPRFSPLPWTSLGNFPGSLGRYMWKDRKIPVLTIELKGNDGVKKLEDFDRLQDISGTVAIQADQLSKSIK